MCLRAEATHPQMCGDGAVPSFCRTKGLRQEPEVGEHVVRANATHPKGVAVAAKPSCTHTNAAAGGDSGKVLWRHQRS